MRIDGAVALMTGENRGIDAAVVDALAKNGASKIYAAARDPRTVRHTPASCRCASM
ncbi:hypothetical protein [Actinacidiphila glaucinigra]|uniref:hypothetical protein n=1 Tax=Actinacidiphila glaucinigra TaxID=235986 RepID=UPI0035E21C6D